MLLCLITTMAQSQGNSDKGYLIQLIEDNLSDGSRDVNIIGFQGALSSAATLDMLTVADVDGIWLTLEGVALTWNRSALLRGKIDVKNLSAERIIVARAPVSQNSAPSPEATRFSLPALPVGIYLDQLNIAEITLGKAVLGEEISLSLTGSATLADGEGSAVVTATRLGTKTGQFVIDGSYENENRILAMSLTLLEGPDGIAANLIDLPGRPSIDLRIAGSSPIDNYVASLSLATDGADRVNGTFALFADDDGQMINLDISGDVTPLFAPKYQDFFGDDIALTVQAQTGLNGEIDVQDLSLTAKAVQLSGTAKIGAQGWPEQFDLKGQVANQSGDSVLLPLLGPETYIDSALFDLSFDTAVSSDWTTDLSLLGFDRPGLYIRNLKIAGGGILVPSEGGSIGEVTANLTYAASGLELDNVGASQAFGDTVSGVLQAARTEGAPTKIKRLTLTGSGLEILAEATIGGTASGLRTQSNIVLTIDTLKRFSTLAGRDLAGSGNLAIASTIVPLDGLFNIILSGNTQDLAIGIDQIDAILKGHGTISASVVRDTNGTRLDALRIKTPTSILTARADLTSAGSTAIFDAVFAQANLIEPRLSGPIHIAGTANQDTFGSFNVDISGDAQNTDFTLTAVIKSTDTGRTVNFTTNAAVTDLAAYAALSGHDIAGAAKVDVMGTMLDDGSQFHIDIEAQTTDLSLGVRQLDPLLRADGVLVATIERSSGDQFHLSDFNLLTDAAGITANAIGGITGDASITLDAIINDTAVLGKGLIGPMTVAINANRDTTDKAQIAMRLIGPGTDIDLHANVSPDYLIEGTLNADFDDLIRYRTLVGHPVSGGVSASLTGSTMVDFSAFDANLNLRTSDLGIGNTITDTLLAGNGQVTAQAKLKKGQLFVNNLVFSTTNVNVSGNLDAQTGAGHGTFTARLRDIGILTDQLSGPLTAEGTASLDKTGNWGVNAQADGPGGITVRAGGQVDANGTVNLTATGEAPLGLANTILEPRRISGDAVFDLEIQGKPNLNAMSGRVDLRDGRLTAPTVAQGLSNVVGGVTFANGTAQIGITADVLSGGSMAVRGPVSLTYPQVADLTLDLSELLIMNPELYQTSISGGITIKGPLAGGARIAGQLNLGQTDIQVPSSGVGALGDLPEVTHIKEVAAVKTTLERASVTAARADQNTSKSNVPPFPLDITITAPSRIFIRGRGLDAELGGTLQIGGTTQNIKPIGLFELTRGRINILQQRFDLTEGSASLRGDFEPYIRLVATTEARTGTVVSIIIEGPATEPHVSFTSTPSLPQDEILSQLIFGRDLQNISPLQAVQLAAAVGTLSGRGGGGLIDNFRKNIGLDDFDVTTDENGNAALRIGKYLSENIYTDVTVSSDGSTEINLNLDITDEITAKGTVDADSETSIGIFFERDY